MKKQLYLLSFLLIAHGIACYASKFIDKEGSEFNKPWVKNVIQKFKAIPTEVNETAYLGAWTNNKITKPRYTQTSANAWGIIQGGQNHFQSIMRLPFHLGLGKYIVVTGGDPHGRNKDHPKTKGSQLFVIKMASEGDKLVWSGNLNKEKEPNQRDKIVSAVDLDKDLWHVGGVDIEGKYLAVPVEKGGVNEDSGDKSKIIFYDISTPEKPKQVTEIIRKGVKAGAASLIRLNDGHYLLGVWSDSDKKPIRYDFYYSKSTDLEKGFSRQAYTLNADKFAGHDKGKKYQNMNFVRDYTTGLIYVVATRNTSKLAPVFNGKDEADLLQLLYSGPKKISLVYLKNAKKHFYCKDRQCNFAAGSGLFVPDCNSMALYAVPHWLPDDGKTIHFNQYFYVDPDSFEHLSKEEKRSYKKFSKTIDKLTSFVTGDTEQNEN